MATPTPSPRDIVVKSYFKKYDSDGNDQINIKELNNLCYDLGYVITDPIEIQAVLRKLDKDHSGFVSWTEFYTWYQSHDKFQALASAIEDPILCKAIEMFKSYDKDLSGKISFVEYKSLCAAMGQINQTDRDYYSGLLKLDANKDGQIDFNEFMNWLKWD
jgi:Ca2+-binding EF-hand superfamily protein